MWMEGRSKVLRQFRLPLRILENRRLRGCQVKLQIYDLHPTIDLRFRSAGDSLDPLDSYRSSSSTINLSTVDVVLVAKLCEGISCPLAQGGRGSPTLLPCPAPLCPPSKRHYTERPFARSFSKPLEGSSSQILFSSWAKRTGKKKGALLAWSDSTRFIVASDEKGAERGNL